MMEYFRSQNRKGKGTLSLCLLGLLLGTLIISIGCGRRWSVQGGSFPQESTATPSVTRPSIEQEKPTPPPEPVYQGKEESDEITRRAEALKREAERLAQQADQPKEQEGSKNQRGNEISGSAGQEKGWQAGPEGPAEVSGTFRAIPELSDVFFAYNEFLLSEEAQGILQKNAEWLRVHPQGRILIEGHCDERGTVEYNLALGERRAQAAKDHLVSLGIAADRISIISYGKERPFALSHNEEAWVQNRRAHFLLRSP